MGYIVGAGIESSDENYNGAPQRSYDGAEMETVTRASPSALDTGPGNNDGIGMEGHNRAHNRGP